jgi:hypothetical protein
MCESRKKTHNVAVANGIKDHQGEDHQNGSTTTDGSSIKKGRLDLDEEGMKKNRSTIVRGRISVSCMCEFAGIS